MRALVRICAGCVALALLGSYLGALHPLGDSLAVFRVWIAGGLGFFALILLVHDKRMALAALAFAAFASAPILLAFQNHDVAVPEETITIYSKNVLGGRGDNAAILADIRETGADIIFLQEVSSQRGFLARDLRDSHPFLQSCRFSDWSGMQVISRWPMSDHYCSPHRSFAAARVTTPVGPVWAVSTHLVWPHPYPQREVMGLALPFLQDVDGQAIVAGDFNMVPWGATVRQIAGLTGTQRIGPLFTTLRVRGVPLQIDHVLTNGQGSTDLRPRFGVDHHGLVAQIGWPDRD